MSRKWIITLVVAGVIAVVAVVGLVVGITTHTETTHLTVCWTNGRAQYVEPVEGVADIGQCPDPVPARWKRDRIPLRVASVEESQGANRPDLVKRAVQHMNSQVRFKLLRYVEQDQQSDIAVQWGVAQASGDAPADCRHLGEGGFVTSAIIKMRNTGGDRTTWKALLHELGHGVGLGHDDFMDSVMYWEQQDDTFEVMRLDRFTDSDVRWLNDEYAPAN